MALGDILKGLIWNGDEEETDGQPVPSAFDGLEPVKEDEFLHPSDAVRYKADEDKFSTLPTDVMVKPVDERFTTTPREQRMNWDFMSDVSASAPVMQGNATQQKTQPTYGIGEAVSNALTNSPNGFVENRNKTTGDPKEMLTSALEEYNRLKSLDARDLDTNKDGIWKNIGKQLSLGLNQVGQLAANPNITDSQFFNMALGTSLGRALTGVVAPHADEQEQLEYKRAKAEQNVAKTQDIYNKDIDAQMRQKQIEGIDSQINDRTKQQEVDLINARTKEKQINQQGDKTLIDSYRKQWERVTEFDPINDKEDKELSDAYARLTGVPMLPKSAGVFKSEAVADASTGKVYFRTLDKNGKVIKDATGWLKSDGSYTTDKEQAGIFQDAYVRATQINAQTRITTNTADNDTRVKIANIQTTSRERLAAASNEDDYVKMQLGAFDDAMKAQDYRKSDGSGKYSEDELKAARARIEREARETYKTKGQ